MKTLKALLNKNKGEKEEIYLHLQITMLQLESRVIEGLCYLYPYIFREVDFSLTEGCI